MSITLLQVAALASEGIQKAIHFFGISPATLIVPYTAQQIKILCATIDDWAILICSFTGVIDNHFPKHPVLSFFKEHPVVFSKMTHSKPIFQAPNIFTDGSKTGCGAFWVEGHDPQIVQFQPGTPQQTELQIVIKVFATFECAFNLLSDSAYVVNALSLLEITGPIKRASPIFCSLKELQDLIWIRKNPFYVQHIRAHSGLPGPLSEGNAIVDNATRIPFIFYTALSEA